MRYLGLVLAGFLTLVGGIAHADVEKSAAINGTGYAIVSGLFDGSTGSSSFIRLINANSSATTFTVLVINTTNAITVGSASITVPAYAAPQYPLTGSGNSIFTLAGVAPSTNAAYALYIQDTDVGAGYAHVSFNSTSTLFENQSLCATPLNQRLTSVGRQVLTNVHTTALAGNNYPSVISIHNYSTAATAVNLAVYDSATGASLGSTIQTISANGTLTMAESQLESLIRFTPTSSQLHLTIVVTHSSGAAAPVTVTQSIRNIQLGGEINMGQVCAVNAVSATVTNPAPASTAPVAYCGSFRFPASFPAPFPFYSYSFTMAVATNGRIRGAVFGAAANYEDAGDTFTGLLTGTSVTMTTSQGLSGIGTIQNGSLNVTFASPYGNFTVTGSQNSCS